MSRPVLNWSQWLAEGDQFLNAVVPATRHSKFGPAIRYNLLSIAMESYIMAMLDYHYSLPMNHTYTDLIEGLDSVIPVPEDLKNRILQYEGIQAICSVDRYFIRDPQEHELVDLQGAIEEIKKMAHVQCALPRPAKRVFLPMAALQ